MVQKTDGSVVKVPAKGGQTVVHRGERVVVQPAGSGGYGHPLERDRERVLADIADGYISADAARRLYRVEPDAHDAHAAPVDAPLAVTSE
jgi:N-methylhydantoinase B